MVNQRIRHIHKMYKKCKQTFQSVCFKKYLYIQIQLNFRSNEINLVFFFNSAIRFNYIDSQIDTSQAPLITTRAPPTKGGYNHISELPYYIAGACTCRKSNHTNLCTPDYFQTDLHDFAAAALFAFDSNYVMNRFASAVSPATSRFPSVLSAFCRHTPTYAAYLSSWEAFPCVVTRRRRRIRRRKNKSARLCRKQKTIDEIFIKETV